MNGAQSAGSHSSIHPQGWVPIETGGAIKRAMRCFSFPYVAFTPKGGCPLKRYLEDAHIEDGWLTAGSIHPQGWVPIETDLNISIEGVALSVLVAFTPKGGCPLKLISPLRSASHGFTPVAFTPKGGCPLKPYYCSDRTAARTVRSGSIHPQGWVPIETTLPGPALYAANANASSIHPQGWVPIETIVFEYNSRRSGDIEVAFTPKGGCPLKRRDADARRSRSQSA
jgi:hypothetical protein